MTGPARAAGFVQTLRKGLERRERTLLARPARAAVLVPIVADGAPLRLLLTRRTEALPTHAGQVAFPGGLVEPGEEDPILTAVREAEEEIGLPREAVEILGLLDDLPTRDDRVAVTPVVGLLPRVPPLVPQTAEVARIFDVPVDHLLQNDRWTARREGGRLIYYFLHEGETLWGLSARIVLNLLGVGSPGFAPPAVRADAP